MSSGSEAEGDVSGWEEEEEGSAVGVEIAVLRGAWEEGEGPR